MEPYAEPFVIRGYDLDPRGALPAASLCRFLQESAGLHAALLGVSMERLIEERLAWVLHRLKLVLPEGNGRRWPPKANLTVRTWPSGFERFHALRDFEVLGPQGEVIAKAASRWVIVDIDQRRLSRLPDFVRALPVLERFSVPMESNQKLDPVDPLLCERRFEVRQSDLDIVGHVNNVRYVQWVSETLPEDHRDRNLLGLELLFRREAHFGETVICRTGRASEDGLAHRLIAEGDGRELVQARTRWSQS